MRTAALMASFALCAVAQTFPVGGVVVDAGSGSPMNRVRVMLQPYGRPTEMRAIVTGPDGRFSFEVPKGRFSINSEYRGMRQPFGQSGPGAGFGVSIYTGPDQDTSNLRFRWFAPGAISGKVTDDHGEPVENALVQLIRVSVSLGRKVRSTAAWARTNDLGEYRFGQRTGGTYYLVATGEPWYSARAQQVRLPGANSSDAPREPLRSYPPAYYPGSDASGAQPLELAPGAEVTADFQLQTVTGVNVHVHCPHPRGQSVIMYMTSEGVAGVETFQREIWLTGDDQTVGGVTPGLYTVRVEGRNGNTSSARKTINVGQSDVSVDLTLAPGASVSGTVVFQDPAPKPQRAVYVRLVDESNGASMNRALDSAGGFSFENVVPGRRRIQLTGADGFFAAKIAAEGARMEGASFELAAGAAVRLAVTASGEVGSLKGFVMNGDKPVTGALAVLVPRDGSPDPMAYRGFETDSDGSYDYQNVRAGDYILIAVERLDLEYANPAAVRPYLASGTPVHIAPHATVKQNTALSPPQH
ncbi:MAG TPA: carboxypeptidase-like regulatory domain-containing protein [Bryobacteraceae bacterium]|nr:carboxypeptidase-like regulatory domain-containing protein [Bryobacteraceae bacterium]